MKIRVFPDQRTASVYAASMVEMVVEGLTSPVLGLATGGTMRELYAQLIQFHRNGLSFRDVTTINLDEYVGLAPDHPNSYHSFMNHQLLNHIDVNPSCVFIPRGDANNMAEACETYDEIIRKYPIDLQLLGIGVNGHIGFNEPGSSLKPNTHVVDLTDDTMRENARFFDGRGDVPTRAITVGLQSILLAKSVLLLAFGEKKAAAIAQTVQGDISTNMPASFLQVHPNVTLVLDEAAAQLL